MRENKKATCLDNVPTPYQNILEFKELSKVYDIEMETISMQMVEIYNNRHMGSLNEYGCERWEKILNLKINSSYSLEDRNFNIKAKYLGFSPYTLLNLHKILSNLVGKENYKLELDLDKNHLNCKLNLGVKHQMSSVVDLLEKIVPLNISLIVELLYNTHEILGQYTHEYLSQFTHQQLREELING